MEAVQYQQEFSNVNNNLFNRSKPVNNYIRQLSFDDALNPCYGMTENHQNHQNHQQNKTFHRSQSYNEAQTHSGWLRRLDFEIIDECDDSEYSQQGSCEQSSICYYDVPQPTETIEAEEFQLKRCPDNTNFFDGHCFSANKRRNQEECEELSLGFGMKNHSEVISQTISTMGTEIGSGDMECEGYTNGTPQKMLPTSKNIRNQGLQAITPSTLVNFMSNPQGHNYIIIDCRYDYEFHGGHIPGAVHIDSPSFLETLLITYRHYLFNHNSLEYIKENFSMLQNQPHLLNSIQIDHINQKAPVLIFHCEFSQKRGPRALRMLREIDRQLNYNTGPNLYYPEVYILEGGYSAFHKQYPHYTNPQNSYIKMVDERYRSHYCQAREKEKRTWEIKTSFGKVLKRSKTINDF